jgi:hypothetical protein
VCRSRTNSFEFLVPDFGLCEDLEEKMKSAIDQAAWVLLLSGMAAWAGEVEKKAEPPKPAAVAAWLAPKHDEKGNLLPLQSYGETIQRGMKFLLVDQATWAKGNKITDDEGKIRPPYFFHSVATLNGSLDTVVSINKQVSYPAGFYAWYIESFLNYYVYSGDTTALRLAEELAAWNMAHSTRADWKYGNLPYSTVQNGKVGGGTDGDAIMTDKPAIMAGAYLRLYRMTRKAEYLEAAERIAVTLTKNQLPEGNWPFRVNPKTGAVREAYTSSVIYAVELFEQLDTLSGQRRFAPAREKALRWLLDGPVRDMNWNGFYEDVGENKNNRTNWDCIDTACYLLRHRADNKEYQAQTFRLYDWVKKTFVDEKHRYAPAPAVREQLACNYRMADHSAHWSALLGEMIEATGEEKYRVDLLNVASLITYHLQADNSIPIGPEWNAEKGTYWYSTSFISVRFLIEILGYCPEAAPNDENHLLRCTAEVRSIVYRANSVVYATDAPSSDVLKLAFVPAKITVNGLAIPSGDGTGESWKFDAKTNVLHIAHKAGEVVVDSER